MEWNGSGWSCVYPPMDEGSWAIECLVQAPVSAVGALSFEAFYRRDRDQVAKALALTIGDGALAVEATDEAMARALARWDRIGTYDNPGGWVFRVGLNWARSWLRRRRFEHELPASHHVEVHDPDVRADLDRALASLDVKHRSVVVLRHVLGYSGLETAKTLGISEGTVKSRLSRALVRLRNELEDHDV